MRGLIKLHARTVLGGKKEVSLLESGSHFRSVLREGFHCINNRQALKSSV